MTECTHDPRFHLMGATNGCCACQCERQAADIAELRSALQGQPLKQWEVGLERYDEDAKCPYCGCGQYIDGSRWPHTDPNACIVALKLVVAHVQDELDCADGSEIERLRLENNRLHTECGHLQADLAEAKQEIERLRDRLGHCSDCCCARAWKALGITEYTGRSIPEEIERLRAEVERLKEIVARNDVE